jgi:hypothetical protein
LKGTIVDRLPQPAYAVPRAHERIRKLADKATEIVAVAAIIIAGIVLLLRLGLTLLGDDPYPAPPQEPVSVTSHWCPESKYDSYGRAMSGSLTSSLDRCYTYDYSGQLETITKPKEPGFWTLLGHNLLAGLDWWLWLSGIVAFSWLLGWLVSRSTRGIEQRGRRAHERRRAELTEVARQRPYVITGLEYKVPELTRRQRRRGLETPATIEVTGLPLDNLNGKPETWVFKSGQVRWASVSSSGTLACFPQAGYSNTGHLIRGSSLRVMSSTNEYDLPEETFDELAGPAADITSLRAQLRLLSEF